MQNISVNVTHGPWVEPWHVSLRCRYKIGLGIKTGRSIVRYRLNRDSSVVAHESYKSIPLCFFALNNRSFRYWHRNSSMLPDHLSCLLLVRSQKKANSKPAESKII